MLFRFSFRSVLRVISRASLTSFDMKADIYTTKTAKDIREEEIPEEMQDLANEYQ